MGRSKKYIIIYNTNLWFLFQSKHEARSCSQGEVARKKKKEKAIGEKETDRAKESWLVMFEASNISNRSIVSRETTESFALNIN